MRSVWLNLYGCEAVRHKLKNGQKIQPNSTMIKFIYSEKATKILRNLPLTFDHSTYSQKLVEDFAKFCGLLRIYELYLLSSTYVFGF